MMKVMCVKNTKTIYDVKLKGIRLKVTLTVKEIILTDYFIYLLSISKRFIK